MIKLIKYEDSEAFLAENKQRASSVNESVEKTVKQIIDNVKANGDKAVKEYTKKFDCEKPLFYEVPRDAINDALTNADSEFVDSMLNAIENITDFHQRQKQNGYMVAKDNGVILGQRVRGLDKVGLYVPGGTAPLPSSLIMNAIPAKIAGVGEVIVTTPPQKDGSANSDILVAAALCGVDRIFLAGGAQAVAALAFGTDEIPKVSKIVGPGNIFVATAKKMLFGTIDIDMIAGPSEILIIADEKANSRYIAADLLSQAEHDKLSSSILVTNSEKLGIEVKEQISKQITNLDRKEIAEKSLENYGAIIVCNNMSECVDIANIIAAEHVEVLAENPLEFIGKIDNVGSLFLGEYSPEALGDYYAGPNHVLPTSGTARFFSPLGVDSFIKKSSYIYYTKEALELGKDDIVRIALREKLEAHANSIAVRFED